MHRYLIRRLFIAVFVIIMVTIIAFASIQFVPADVVTLMLGRHSTPEAETALRHKLGLDQPPVQQYLRWFGKLIRGDLSESLRTQQPIKELLIQRIPVTVELAFFATLVALLIGIPTGIIAAVKQYSLMDMVSTVLAMIGLSMPEFWLATLFILVLSIGLKILPPGGVLPGLFDEPWTNLKRMIMPALSLGLPSAAVYFRMTRSSLLEVIRSDYMRTAFAKGLSERMAVMGHALKNALIPVVTVTGMEITWMLGGSFIIETIFSLPGLGRATVQSIYQRDFTVLQACLLVYSTLVVGISFLVDLAYVLLDPRIRYD
ncbi:MAG: ABC transporter permease [Anaerolineales bacterium]|nr:ABC transporter permease [Anaerolineales bacterium]